MNSPVVEYRNTGARLLVRHWGMSVNDRQSSGSDLQYSLCDRSENTTIDLVVAVLLTYISAVV